MPTQDGTSGPERDTRLRYLIMGAETLPPGVQPVALRILINMLRDDPEIRLVEAGEAALTAGRLAVVMTADRAARLRAQFGRRLVVLPQEEGGKPGALREPAPAPGPRARYLVGPDATWPGAPVSLAILANLLAEETGVAIRERQGPPAAPTLLAVEMTAERAARLRAEFRGRLIVEVDEPLEPL